MLEAVGRAELQRAWRPWEGAQLVVARDEVALVEEVVQIELQLQVTYLVVEGGVHEGVAWVADGLGTAADLPQALRDPMYPEAEAEAT